MQQQVQRPDTPLAATPEPMPVSSGQMPQRPINKFQATADAAISQIKTMNAPAQPQQDTNQQ
jgi:hypothetical protein